MPVRFANTAALQRDQLNAGLLTLEDREVVFVRLLQQTAVIGGGSQRTEMEQVRLGVDRLGRDPGVAEPGRIEQDFRVDFEGGFGDRTNIITEQPRAEYRHHILIARHAVA